MVADFENKILPSFLLNLPDLSYLLPKMLSNGWGGSVDPLTNSWTICSNNFKLGRVLGLFFQVSKIADLMKSRLHGNHDNYSTTRCFFAIFCRNVVKNHPILNAF